MTLVFQFQQIQYLIFRNLNLKVIAKIHLQMRFNDDMLKEVSVRRLLLSWVKVEESLQLNLNNFGKTIQR